MAALLDFAILLGELVVLFLLAAFIVAMAARRLGVQRLRRLMGGSRVGGALKGIAVGFVTPFCTYSAIPVLVAMRSSGVRTSAWVGFLLAAPVLDPLIAVAIGVIFSVGAAVAYSVATFTGVLAAAVLADVLRLERFTVAAPAGAADPPPAGPPAGVTPGPVVCSPDPLADVSPWRGWRAEGPRAGGYAVDLVRGMALPLVIAVAFAGAIAGFLPQSLLVAVAGPSNPLAVPLAAIAGTPFYVSGEAFLPIAAALLDKGMGAGAVFALIIAGAGVNLPELALLRRILHPRLLAALVAAIFAIATLAGYLIPGLVG